MSVLWGSRSDARRWGTWGLVAAAIPLLAGCSLVEPNNPGEELSSLAACALGHTWSTDFDDASAQITEILKGDKVAVTDVTSTGSQTLEWSIEGHVVLTSSYALTITSAPAADQVVTVIQTHTGKATGAAYINGEVAIPRKWDGTGIKIDTVADNNGTVLDELPYPVPQTSIDDSVGLELTCSGNTLTIHPRGSSLTQTWTRSG